MRNRRRAEDLHHLLTEAGNDVTTKELQRRRRRVGCRSCFVILLIVVCFVTSVLFLPTTKKTSQPRKAVKTSHEDGDSLEEQHPGNEIVARQAKSSETKEQTRRGATTEQQFHNVAVPPNAMEHRSAAVNIVEQSGVATPASPAGDTTSSIDLRRRFPRYGTPEFSQECNWTMYPPVQQNCTVFWRPHDTGNEGLADWVTKMVAGYLTSKLKGGCQFLMDYGLGVDLPQILAPHMESLNWTVPTGFTCERRSMCERAISHGMLRRASNETSASRYNDMLVPNYRHVFKNKPSFQLFRENFRHIEKALPGFTLETGMACAFERLVDLSPLASQFEPELFTHILPTLRDEGNLVLALYYRSGRTDIVAEAEKQGNSTPTEHEDTYRRGVQRYAIPCVLAKEKMFLASNPLGYSRVVWLVVSDSPYLKRWITEEYTSPNVNHGSHDDGSSSNGVMIPREIITTVSRGVHTRPGRNPSTADFADGMIDWYLMGESDIVFVNGRGYTFGTTAAFRTNRPLYDLMPKECPEMTFIHEDETPPMAKVRHGKRWKRSGDWNVTKGTR